MDITKHPKYLELLAKANSASTLLIFPFRSSLVPILQWASKNSTSWKPNYYSALIMRDKNKKEEEDKKKLPIESTNIDIDELSIQAGKMEAEIDNKKYKK